MQELVLDRSTYELCIDQSFFCFALENPARLIPPGLYKVVLSVSDRARKGELWTPWPSHQLPQLYDNQGDPAKLDNDTRTGIRIHAANLVKQLEGCIALGLDRAEGNLLQSRAALTLFRAKVRFPAWLEIK